MVPEIWSTTDRVFFIIVDDFLPCYPTNNPINQNFVQIKKAPGDVILQMCAINENHMMNALYIFKFNFYVDFYSFIFFNF